jgi:large subunit ribosomal protein L13
MKTYSAKLSEIKREKHTIDASDQVLGRLATRVAGLLMGKSKVTFSRSMDIGDFVIVTNAKKIKLTGKKPEQKMYYRHSGYPGGLRSENFDSLIETHPERAIEFAVKGMLPTNRLRARMMKRLTVHTGALPVKTKVEKAAPAAEEKKG